MFNSLHGIKVIKSSHCVITHIEKQKRTWRERLFMFPWKPWKAYKYIVIQEPDPKIYFVDTNTVVGHPTTICMLEQILKEEKYDGYPTKS